MTLPKTLVVEDDPQAALALQYAFQQAGLRAGLHFIGDGVEAVEYLQGKELFAQVASSTLPGLLLLDLDLPRLSGFGVLRWLHQHPHLRPKRVVVFSASDRVEDRAQASALGADHYLVKPSEPAGFSAVVRQLHYWCHVSPPPVLEAASAARRYAPAA